MKCPSCNAELPATAKFCGACGTTLSSAPEPVWTPPPAPEQAWAPPPPPEQAWAPPPPPEQAWAPPPPPPDQAWAPPPPGQDQPWTPPPPQQFGQPATYGSAPPIEKRFKALRLIAVLLKVFAFIAAGISVILALITLFAGASAGSATRSGPGLGSDFGGPSMMSAGVGFLGAVVQLIFGAITFIFLYAYAEVIHLFLSIEEHTRATSDILRNR